MTIVHACTVATVHACTVASVHAYTVAAVYECTMAIAIVHACTMAIVRACATIEGQNLAPPQLVGAKSSWQARWSPLQPFCPNIGTVTVCFVDM